MAWINTRGTRLSQPSGPVEVDWGNPLSKGLVSVINPASRDWLTIGAPSVSAGDQGIKLDGNGSSMVYKSTPKFGSEATILYVGNFLTGAHFQVGVGTSGGGNQLFIIQPGASGVAWPRGLIRTANGGGVSTVEVSGSAPESEWTTTDVWACVYDGTNQLRIYRNGVDVSGTRNNTAASGAMSDMDNFALGGVNRGTDGFAKSGQFEYLGYAWNRALSAAELSEIGQSLKAPWQLFKPVTRRVYFDVGGSSGLTITPPLLTNSNDLYAPTVSAGGSVVQAPLLTNTSDLFSPTLNPGAVQVAPPLLPSENAFFAPVVSAGGSVVQAPLLTNTSTIYGPTVGVGAVAIAPQLFTNISTIYAPSVAASGPQTIDAPLFTNSSTIYAPSVGEVSPLSDAEMRHMYEMVQAIYAAVVTNAPLDVNLVRVRGQSIIGTGAAADPWGPA